MALDIELAGYVARLLETPLRYLHPVATQVRDVGPIATVTLHRDPPFQAELVIVKPGGQGFPEHLHPNVDSIEIVLTGSIKFTRNGTRIQSDEEHEAWWASGTLGLLSIPHTDWHGADVGPAGAVFISCQRWLNGVEPTTVGADWEGAALDPRHEAVWAAEGRSRLMEVS